LGGGGGWFKTTPGARGERGKRRGRWEVACGPKGTNPKVWKPREIGTQPPNTGPPPPSLSRVWVRGGPTTMGGWKDLWVRANSVVFGNNLRGSLRFWDFCGLKCLGYFFFFWFWFCCGGAPKANGGKKTPPQEKGPTKKWVWGGFTHNFCWGGGTWGPRKGFGVLCMGVWRKGTKGGGGGRKKQPQPRVITGPIGPQPPWFP